MNHAPESPIESGNAHDAGVARPLPHGRGSDRGYAIRRKCYGPLSIILSTVAGCTVGGWYGDSWGKLPVHVLAEPTRAVKQAMVQQVRRDIAAMLEGRPLGEDVFPPDESWSVSELFITLRAKGYVRAVGSSRSGYIRIAIAEAVAGVLKSESLGDPPSLLVLNDMAVEMEICGGDSVTRSGVNLAELRRMIAVDRWRGYAVYHDGVRSMVRPSEIVTRNLLPDEVLELLADRAGIAVRDVHRCSLGRFQSYLWHQPIAGANVVELDGGLRVLPEDYVRQVHLTRAIRQLGDYLTRRVKPVGWFTYEYEPSTDTYADADHFVRQAGAAGVLSEYGRKAGDDGAAVLADKVIDKFLRMVTPLEDRKDAAFVGTPDGRNKLGVTALLALALVDRPEHAGVRDRLINGMLALQEDDGHFRTSFSAGRRSFSQDFFPGEALLAISRTYEITGDERLAEAVERALPFYRTYFRREKKPPFVPWQVQAYALMARLTGQSAYADFAFEMSDWLAEKQLGLDNCDDPALWGGIAAYLPDFAGVATASYLEGFNAALELARHQGDTGRAERYQEVVRRSCRFVMQLALRPEECWYVPNLEATVGGVRTSLSHNTIRIDHIQHALRGLAGARDLLYPASGHSEASPANSG